MYHLWKSDGGPPVPGDKVRYHNATDDELNLDYFAYAEVYCNGPECVRCGYSFCHHCNPKGYESQCHVAL